MAKTALKNRIKSVYLRGGTDPVADNTEVEDELVDSIKFQEDVKVIGFWLEGELDLASAALPDDQAKSRGSAFLGRGDSQDYDARLGMVHTKFHSFLATGASAPSSAPNQLISRMTVMFGGENGFDLDEGDSLYLWVTLRNYSMANNTMSGTAEIFYTER